MVNDRTVKESIMFTPRWGYIINSDGDMLPVRIEQAAEEIREKERVFASMIYAQRDQERWL